MKLALMKVEEALSMLKNFKLRLSVEELPLHNSLGRVLAQDVTSSMDYPPFSKATRDGFALRSEDTLAAGEDSPVVLAKKYEVRMGHYPEFKLVSGECAYVQTGAPIPEGADAVVPVEECELAGDKLFVYKPYPKFANVVRKGEDIRKGDKILAKGMLLDEKCASLLATLGVSSVKVYERLKVSVVTTGDEIIDVGEELPPGKIYNTNKYLLLSLLNRWNFFDVVYVEHCGDSESDIERALREALRSSHLVLVTGATSKGENDVLPRVVKRFGPKVFIHGLAMKPGKPTIIAAYEDTVLFGLPGNPTSAYTAFKILVEPFVFHVLGAQRRVLRVRATISERVYIEPNKTNVVYLKLRAEGGKFWASLHATGSEKVLTFAGSDGYAVVRRPGSYLEEGEEIEICVDW